MSDLNKENLLKMLDEMNIKYEIYTHSPMFTIEDSLEMNIPEGLVKNLFLRNDNGKKHYLVTICKEKNADLKQVRSEIGSSRLSFASEERLNKHLKLKKGSVTPLGVINDSENAVEVFFDEDMKNIEKIGVHPLENTATIFLSLDDLIKFINHTGHTVKFIKI